MNMLSQASCPSYKGLYGTGCDAEDTMPHLVLRRAQPNAYVGKVVWALSLIQKLYRIEKARQGCPLEDVYRQRPSASLLLMAAFGQWLSKTTVLPKGYLGKAIRYCQNNGAKLMRYLEDGQLSIDNNRAERAIKPFVIGRKNWLCANTEAGAHDSGLLYSLVETACINGLTPYDYLLALLTALKSPMQISTGQDFSPGASPYLKSCRRSLCGSNDAYVKR